MRHAASSTVRSLRVSMKMKSIGCQSIAGLAPAQHRCWQSNINVGNGTNAARSSLEGKAKTWSKAERRRARLGADELPVRLHAHQDAEPDEERDQRSAAIGNEWQGHADDGQQ